MFVDEVSLVLKAWKWWDGAVSWRREKYIPNGGPYWWNGWSGGNIILRVNQNKNTLSDFRHKKIITAEDGERWGTKVMAWRAWLDRIIEVPIGTIVSDAKNGEKIVDLVLPEETFILCRGWRWGFWNAHFASPTRQAPNFAELGDVWEERQVHMEMKLVADIGIIGLPNAGKSTLIQSLTNVRPKIADYPFTTLVPNLWVMEYKGRSLILEDVPWLIPWASQGKGLGIEFLKHVERTKMLIHLIDGSTDRDTILESYRSIRKELEAWSADLAKKTEIIVISKIDIIDPDMHEILRRELMQHFSRWRNKRPVFMISAGAYIGLESLKDELIRMRTEEWVVPPREDVGNIHIYDLKKSLDDPKDYTIRREWENRFIITWKRLEEIARMTDMRYKDGISRIYDILEKIGAVRKIQSLIEADGAEYRKSFFEGSPDAPIPTVEIAGKSFPLTGIAFSSQKWQ